MMIRLVALAILAGPAVAETKLSVRSEQLDPPTELKPALRRLFDERATTVSDAKPLATFWLRKAIPAAASKESSYRDIASGTLIGVVRFERAWTDFRQQEIEAGIYTLRIVVQPDTKDHEGTAPTRDVCVLSPAKADVDADPVAIKPLLKRSGSITGGTHPVVMLMLPHPKPPAKPALVSKGKLSAIGLRGVVETKGGRGELGLAFTVLGSN